MITHMSLAKLAKRININMRCIEIAMQTTGKMAQQTD